MCNNECHGCPFFAGPRDRHEAELVETYNHFVRLHGWAPCPNAALLRVARSTTAAPDDGPASEPAIRRAFYAEQSATAGRVKFAARLSHAEALQAGLRCNGND